VDLTVHFALQTTRLNCTIALDESAYQASRRFEIPTTVSHSNNGHYMDREIDEDFPSSVDPSTIPIG